MELEIDQVGKQYRRILWGCGISVLRSSSRRTEAVTKAISQGIIKL